MPASELDWTGPRCRPQYLSSRVDYLTIHDAVREAGVGVVGFCLRRRRALSGHAAPRQGQGRPFPSTG